MDYEMVAGIVGTITVDEDAMSALLDWYLPEDSLVVIRQGVSGGPEQIVDWCTDVEQPYQLTNMDMIDLLYNDWGYEEATDVSVIVLGIEGNEDEIRRAWKHGFEVADLTRAMYIIQQGIDLEEALDEPVSHAHEVSDGLGGRGSLDVFVSQDAVQSHGFPMNVKDSWTREELEEIMSGLIKVHEQKYHTPDEVKWQSGGVIRQPAASELSEMTDEELINGKLIVTEDEDFYKVRCLKNKRTGAIRVSPRAKAKPGEEEVFLTQEEIDAQNVSA